MKKTVLFAAALFAVTAASAQSGEITSNRGENWLSQDGDWGLTFSAQPLLTYAGNLFNNGTNGTGTAALNGLWMSPHGSPSVIIAGKKLINANTAYRGKVRIGFGGTTNTDIVPAIPQPTPTPNPPATVENAAKSSYLGISLGAGIEKRVGSTRLVGVYGADFMVGFGSGKTTTTYGNALSTTNPDQNGRVTESKNGSTFAIGLNAFAGIEWFCAPKISLSGEYTWGFALSSRGLASVTSEKWDPTASNGAGAVVTTTQDGDPAIGNSPADKTSSWSIDTGVSGADIGINFYFQ